MCGITLKISCNGAEIKERFCANQNTTKPRRVQNTHTSKNAFFNSLYGPASWTHTKSDTRYVGHPLYATDRTSTHFPPGSPESEHVRLYPSCAFYKSVLSREQTRLARSNLKKSLLRLPSWGRRSDWALRYCINQLLTPHFPGGSTLNGTPGGARWVRVLCGQSGWLSEPLHRVDADCSGCTNLRMQTHGKEEKIPPHRKHTTKPTSAQRPRPPRDGAQKIMPHALAHTRPLL